MKENNMQEVQLDKSMILYQPTIVDKVLHQQMADGSSIFVSDIAVLKGISLDDANGPLVEALSMRMEVRPSTPSSKIKMSDDQILATIKARGVQDPTEIERYHSALKDMLGYEMNEQDYQDALERVEKRKQEQEQVEQPKTE